MEEMLSESFIFLPGVQEKTERRLWEAGIHTWDHLLEVRSIPGTSKERLLFWKSRIRHAQALLTTPGGRYAITRMLGTRHAWRAAKHVLAEPRFLDIETTEYCHDVTVVGVSDGEFYQAFVKGANLQVHELRRALAGATCLITFNGSSFDLPILARAFPAALPSVPHLDLRHLCAQAGLRGGLKHIEQHLGIARAATIRETDGADAIMLWYRHLYGDREALGELVDYNAADVLNLKPLLDLVLPALWNKVRHGVEPPFHPCPLWENQPFK